MSDSDSDDDLQIIEEVSQPQPGPSSSKTPEPDKPLLKLIKQLVNHLDNEEKTILTNSQLLESLNKEFMIDTQKSHKLALDIYMNVLKKFLKTWPRWDMVDQAVQEAKSNKAIDIEKILLEEYASLKKYLKNALDLSKEPIAEALRKLSLLESEKRKNEAKTPSAPEAVLEVACSREQLNNLIFKQPHPDQNNTIFNLTKNMETEISLRSHLTLDKILNWTCINITINLNMFEYTRKNASTLKHTIVNRRLNYTPTAPVISQDAHYRPTANRKTDYVVKKDLQDFLAQLTGAVKKLKIPSYDIINYIILLVRTDLMHAPELINRWSEFMYFNSRHAYVRYLSTDVETLKTEELKEAKQLYCLELEEIIIPATIFSVGNFVLTTKLQNEFPYITNDLLKIFKSEDYRKWLKVECTYCNRVFYGLTELQMLREHFLEKHCHEQDWKCMNCNKTCSMQYLASRLWGHICKEKGSKGGNKASKSKNKL